MRLTKYVAVALVVTFALSACGLDRPPAPLRGDPAPSPQPTGVLYGRVMHADGASAPRSTVEVAVTDRNTLGTVLLAIGTLGLACLIPTLCDPVRTRPDGEGLWSADQDELRDAPGLRVDAELGSDGPASGPGTTLSLPASDEVPRRVPDLVYWDPEVAVTGKGGRLDVAWPALADVPSDGTTTYTTIVAETAGRTPMTHVVSADAEATTASVDARVYADVPSELRVVARTTTRFDGEALDTAYRSAGVPLPELTPPSRGAPCLVEDAGSGRLEPAASPCPYTDGNTEDRDPVALPSACATGAPASAGPDAAASRPTDGGPTADAADPCAEPAPRACVRLPEPREVSLVVLRTPFPLRGDDAVELLDADHRVVYSVAAGRDPGDDPDAVSGSGLYPVRVDRPVRAALVCTHDGQGRALDLTELSVW
ncbi:hypothetical protein [Myceligenerans pegani]|uniref:Uncharacterized protein n=1 Tax=Myceligenerans pegani TaxID=2776917 RepID=A0ABR9MVR8_9MICO|nr:hypothetical protein [Myceligenerans sp. TRM 65318]MBE1875019.1 hypothetical protein [Myceligenerans sp. TRM 65318]MBE3017290.1 hypothetical protein [Myceligenerans sp. TRM 65318]